MKQVFDWMRKMVVESSFPVGGIPEEERVLMRRKAKEIIDRAEEKWNADVCEWKPYLYHEDRWVIGCCGCESGKNDTDGYEFCPFCGKKIKVV